MALGTAPRRVSPGVWVTASGRKLSPAGSAYWENHFRSGRTDGKGHVTKQSVVQQTGPTKEQIGAARLANRFERVAPATKADVIRAGLLSKKPGIASRFTKDIEGAITGLVPGTAEIVKATGKDLASAGGALGHKAGSKQAHGDLSFKHSRQLGTAIGKGYVESLKHPSEHPGNFLLALLPGYGAAGKVALAADAARLSEGAGLAAAAKALVKSTPRQVRSVKVGGADIPIPAGATPEDIKAIRAAKNPVEVARFSSRNYLTHKLLTARDRSMVRGIETGGVSPTADLNVLSPQSGFGRELSRQKQGREARAMAPAAAFERFARGKQKLTPAEEKAVEIVARGQSPETFLKAHVTAREKAIAQLESGSAAGAEHLSDRTAHHGAHAELTQQAAEIVRNPSPKMKQAFAEARALMQARERHLGLTADEAAHSIGKAHDEIAAMAAGRKSLGQKIADAEIADNTELAATLHKQATELGHKAIDNGAFYLPFKTTHPLRTMPASSRSPVGLGPPKIPKMKTLTGAAFRGGKYRTDTARLLADASREGARVHLAREYWPKIAALSKDTEAAAGGKYAIPMRVTTKIPDEYRQAVLRSMPGDTTPHAADIAAHDKAMLLQNWRFPSKDMVDAETGTVRGTTDKVRWVDRRQVAGLLVRPRPGGLALGGKEVMLGSVFDTINAVPKMLTLYKPGYLLNRVQQFVQNASQQGVFLRRSGQFVDRLHQELNPAEIYELKAIAGAGRSRALAPRTGKLKNTVTRAGEQLGQLTDDASRMLALAHELHTAGLNTPEKVRAALRGSEKDQIKLEAIATRVNQEAIPFGKMSDVEGRTIARLMFFWPWTRAALEWSARFPGEHPFQAAAAGQVGPQGTEATKRLLGNVPSWARGLVPVTGGKTPYTINLANLSTPQTVVDTAQLAGSFGKKVDPYATDSPASQLGPAGAAIYGGLSGTVRGRGSYSPVEAAARAALGSTPELSAFQKLHKPATSIYPGGWLPTVGTYFGGAFPKKTNLAALQKSGKAERAASLSPAAKKYATVFDQRNTTVQQLKDLGIGSRLPPPVKQAFNRQAAREAAWAAAAKGKQPGTREFYVARFLTDVHLAEKWGYMPAKKAAFLRNWVAHAPYDDVKKAHRAMSTSVYDKAFEPAKTTAKWADEQARFKSDLDQAVSAGKVPAARAKTALAWARTHQVDEIKQARLALERAASVGQ